MSKILLVKPKNDLGISPVPLGLLHIGTALEATGFKVKIVDCNKDANHKDTLARELKDALYVGVTCLTTEIKSSLEISDLVKERSDVPVVLGGWHPTLFPAQTCADKSVDFVCINEGDDVAVQLAECLESRDSPAGIDGLAYKGSDHKVKVNPCRKFVDIENLPLCNYDLIDLSKYNLITPDKQRILGYQSSRGCPHRCAFCIQTVTCNNVWRAKSVKKTVDEIELLIHKHKIDFLGFIDDNFFVSRQRVADIAKEILARELDFTWMAECRADYFDRFDRAFLDLLAKSGLVQVNIGAESGSQRIRELLDKDITEEQIVKSARMLSPYDIDPIYCFMVGIPTETKNEIRSTVKLAEKLRKMNPRVQYRMAVLTPYPKCKITDKLISMGVFREPTSLREWAEDAVRKLYTDRFVGKPWHTNPRLLENLSYFSGLAYETYSDKLIGSAVKRFDVRRFPRIFLIFLARLRMKLRWYGFPIDKALFMFLKSRFKKHVQEGKY